MVPKWTEYPDSWTSDNISAEHLFFIFGRMVPNVQRTTQIEEDAFLTWMLSYYQFFSNIFILTPKE